MKNPEFNSNDTRENKAELLIRLLNDAKNIEALHGKKVEEVFKSEESIKEFISNLQPEELVDLISGINGILRGKDKADWEMDGHTVNIGGVLLPSEYTPPKKEDKSALLAELLDKAKEMVRGQQSNEDVALLVASTINAIHPFADANGRTSRLSYILLKEGYNEQSRELLRKSLNEEGREVIDINPAFVRRELELILLYKPLANPENNPLKLSGVFPDKVSKEYKFKEEIPDNLKELFFQIRRDDSDYFRSVVLEYVYGTGNADKYIETFPKEPINEPEVDRGDEGYLRKKRTVVVLSKLTPELDKAAVEEIISKYWKLKKNYVELMMDSIANPNKPEYKIEIDKETIRIIDLFKHEIQKHSQQDTSSE